VGKSDYPVANHLETNIAMAELLGRFTLLFYSSYLSCAKFVSGRSGRKGFYYLCHFF